MRHRVHRFRYRSWLALSTALAAATVSAQQPSPAPPQAPAQTEKPAQEQPPPRFRTEANFVRVDVYPSKDGQPVQDLRMEDFDLLENGARQQVQAFEHIVVSPAGPQSMRAEPNSVRAGEQMAANPRARVFVFFLDVPHVPVEGSHAIKEPLIRLMDRILGPDDLIAVMTPEMSAAQITFGRKSEVIAGMLREGWTWGMRHSVIPMDAREREYERCYPPNGDDLKAGRAVNPIVTKMIARRRERMVLDALHDLVRYLGGVREERKAIIAVTTGWLLYRPDDSLNVLRYDNTTERYEPVPGRPPIGVDEWGKLRVNPPRREPGVDNPDQTVCDRERMYLASIDNDEYFRYLFDVANRNNASFYPIDPRGLPAFDYPMGPAAPPPLPVDAAHLRGRIETLRTLAENTDGLAVVNNNDLDKGLKRIADDLTSYYLLGYYSTNTKLDGQYRRIVVRVKRPGVEVRSRRGYRAATVEDVNASRAAAAAPLPDTVKTMTAALATLGRIRPEQRFALHAVPIFDPGTGKVSAVWIAGELQGPVQEFGAGGTASIDLSGAGTGTASGTINKGERAFLIKVPVQAGSGTLDVRARVTPTAGTIDTPLSDGAKIELTAATVQPLLFRRGLSTGNRLQPVAGFQFSRTDRLRLELPLADDATPGTARVLDRNSQPLQVPVQVGERKGDDGQRWLTADATLSALGAGDYVVEVGYRTAGAEQRVFTAIRVTR